MKFLWLLLIPVILAARGVGADPGGRHPRQPVALTEADNGKTIHLRPGESFCVTLPSNPTTGYSWTYVPAPDNIIDPVGEPEYAADPNDGRRMGASGTETFCFKAVKSGTGRVTLNYRRPWETGTPAKQFEMTVSVDRI